MTSIILAVIGGVLCLLAGMFAAAGGMWAGKHAVSHRATDRDAARLFLGLACVICIAGCVLLVLA